MSSRPSSRQYLRKGRFRSGREAVVVGDGLGFERDGELMLGMVCACEQQGFDLLFAEADEDDAVLAGVGEEDVGECGRDDGAEAVVAERPGGVLAARAAAEVLAGDEDLRALVARDR
jgi:hypothetical protein